MNRLLFTSLTASLFLLGSFTSSIGHTQELEDSNIHSSDLDPLSDSDPYSFNKRRKARMAVLELLKLENGDYVGYCGDEVTTEDETITIDCEKRVKALVNHMFSAAQRYQIDPWDLVSISLENTRFNPYHRSPAGISGVMGVIYQRQWRRTNRFFTSRTFREECHGEEDACQREAIFHTALLVQTSTTECQGDPRLGLQKLISGRCRGNPRFARHVERWRNRLLEIAETIEDVNVCDIHPLVCSDPLEGLGLDNP